MFERFTDRARKVLVLAQDEARVMEHDFLGTEHILLGLVAEGEGVGAKAMEQLGVDLATVRAKVTEVIPVGAPGTASGAPPFTPRAKTVLELAYKEALKLGHNYIGTEHLLLGLAREPDGVASQVLRALGLEVPKITGKVLELLQGYAAANPPKLGTGGGVPASTPAAMAVSVRARSAAAGDPVGSHHFLLGLLDDPASLAARVLTSLGVTREAVASRIKEIGVAGTSDEVRPPTPPSIKVGLGDGIALHVDDPELVERFRHAIQAPNDLTAVVRDALTAWLTKQEQQPPEEDAAPPAPE